MHHIASLHTDQSEKMGHQDRGEHSIVDRQYKSHAQVQSQQPCLCKNIRAFFQTDRDDELLKGIWVFLKLSALPNDEPDLGMIAEQPQEGLCLRGVE